MKTGNFRQLVLASTIAFCSAFAITGYDKNDDDDNNSGMYTISGNDSGSKVVSSVTGNGRGTITGTYNRNTGVMNYTATWNGLSAAPTTAGLYSGVMGANGLAMGNSWSLASNPTGTGSFNGSMTLTAAQASQLTNGNWYYSYGTSANPNGEIRGQITAVQQ